MRDPVFQIHPARGAFVFENGIDAVDGIFKCETSRANTNKEVYQ